MNLSLPFITTTILESTLQFGLLHTLLQWSQFLWVTIWSSVLWPASLPSQCWSQAPVLAEGTMDHSYYKTSWFRSWVFSGARGSSPGFLACLSWHGTHTPGSGAKAVRTLVYSGAPRPRWSLHPPLGLGLKKEEALLLSHTCPELSLSYRWLREGAEMPACCASC